ncbi:hypothetical protein ACFL26_00305 [Patescibacteria group bacterium]
MGDRFDELMAVLKSVGMPPEDFAVFGSGPMCARGLRDCGDLDVVARGAAWDIAREKGAPHAATTSGDEAYAFADGGIEIMQGWFLGDWDTDGLIDTADVIDGVRFVRLEHVLEWKRRMGRDKDRRDIETLERYLAK